jgi:hypothetical protein
MGRIGALEHATRQPEPFTKQQIGEGCGRGQSFRLLPLGRSFKLGEEEATVLEPRVPPRGRLAPTVVATPPKSS